MSEVPLREVILSKAGELFHRKGYSSVSVAEIIAASGLPKAEFYRNYSGKSALGQAWLERLNKRMRLMHENFMDRLGEPERRLKSIFYQCPIESSPMVGELVSLPTRRPRLTAKANQR